ncbi:MAG: hypothetical protein KFB93_03300 [Simkaniaceae bacterium]|nr:MAG: hypothetical protein KFB93_03300 [Simkaniaceae bacterium]
MRKLIMTLSAILLTGTTLLSAEETKNIEEVEQSYGYYGFSGGFPNIFTFSLGQRAQSGHHGLDAGIGITPLLIAVEGHGYLNYLYFPKPNLNSQVYMGLGSQIGYGAFVHGWGDGIGFIKPQLVLGKEYSLSETEKRFIQAELGAAYFSTKGTAVVPSLMITYGVKF